MSVRQILSRPAGRRGKPRSKRGMVLAIAAISVAGIAGIGGSVVNGRSARYSLEAYSLEGMLVQDTGGHPVPLCDGVDRVVLIVSTTCPHCHAVIAALALRAGRAHLPRLTVVALEGAQQGQAMVDSLGLGSTARGPSGGVTAFLHRSRIAATPVLLRLDARGYVRQTLSGEITAKEADEWVTWSK